MDESLLIKIDADLKQQLRREATRRGTSMSKLTRRVLRDYLDEIEAQEDFSRWLDRARGSATTAMTTDEIMALTRGE
jgi:predicted transcriptional regulator